MNPNHDGSATPPDHYDHDWFLNQLRGDREPADPADDVVPVVDAETAGPEAELEPVAEAETESEPEPEPVAEPEPEPVAEPVAGTGPEPVAEPEPEPG